jgi:hypothetical protein
MIIPTFTEKPKKAAIAAAMNNRASVPNWLSTLYTNSIRRASGLNRRSIITAINSADWIQLTDGESIQFVVAERPYSLSVINVAPGLLLF